MMHRVLQPYFALSGYKLRAEPEVANKHRFDLVGDNILEGDDRILVDYKFNRECVLLESFQRQVKENYS